MNCLRLLSVISRRGFRVLALTVLLTTAACCDPDLPFSVCFAEVSHDPCFVAQIGMFCRVIYIPGGSECNSCSTCSGGLRAFDADMGTPGANCIPNCQQVCNTVCA